MTDSFLFDIPQSIEDYLVVLDDFIEREIKPLEAQDDNIRFFDHRREHARTDWDREGCPAKNGRSCCGKCVAGRTQQVTSDTRRRRSSGPKRHQSRDGAYPGTPRQQGPWAAQRPTE